MRLPAEEGQILEPDSSPLVVEHPSFPARTSAEWLRQHGLKGKARIVCECAHLNYCPNYCCTDPILDASKFQDQYSTFNTFAGRSVAGLQKKTCNMPCYMQKCFDKFHCLISVTGTFQQENNNILLQYIWIKGSKSNQTMHEAINMTDFFSLVNLTKNL